jgi:transposase-like protein
MNAKGPESLMEAVEFFADLDGCHAYMERLKWPDGVVRCPHCTGETIGRIASRRMFQCKGCRKQFSVKVGTIFEESPLPLNKWLVAVWCITNAKNGISSCELARAVKVTQKTAWFLLHRVRTAMHSGTFEKIAGVFESDETYIGGKAKNMHHSRRQEKIKGTGGVGKAIVHGLLARGAKGVASKVRATVVPNTKGKTLTPIVRESVVSGSHVYTDSLASYNALSADYVHAAVDHAERYVDGVVHTNGMENFWALFKRCIYGTYVSVDEPHLQRYVDEEVFRFNERKLTDGQRFHVVMPGIVGKRLTYKALTGTDGTSHLRLSVALGGDAISEILSN